MQTRDRIAQSSVPATLGVIGDGWTLSLLTALVGNTLRFEELMKVLTIPRSTLSTRLRHLIDHGLIAPHPYCERPLRFEYALSERGAALLPVLALADAFDVEHGGQPATLRHAPSHGAPHPLRAVACCAACGAAVEARHVVARYAPLPGPRAAPVTTPKQKRVSRSRSARKPLWRARDVLEDAWAAHVVAALFMGAQRFTELLDATQAAPNIVSERLQRLADARLLRHVTAAEREREREHDAADHDAAGHGAAGQDTAGHSAAGHSASERRAAPSVYRLNARGLALYPLVVALIAYGDEGRRVPSLTLTHRCGAPLRLRLSCAGCTDLEYGVPLLPSSVSFAMQVDLCATPTPT
ncbi:MAG: winged helix-turn-helix transcriptional regulator [Myxococcales bacterium]|nr:winged helix-turn-helix transcriptional regulator [Myxococcales bacterium]MCB9629016.1 winged helix-turn-helix transcriptional regulator [Sandaracinaceae bacterium]